MATKLYIPYDVDSSGRSTFLIARSYLKTQALCACLIGKLLVKGLTLDESLVLLWLGERLRPLDTAKVMYLLTLFWETKIEKGIWPLLSPEHWSHQNLDRRFPQLRGDLFRQASRLAGQLRLSLKRERREKPRPIELRRLGVGYRDHGSLSKYNFSWKDTPSDPQVVYTELFARLSDTVIKTHIQKALDDLKLPKKVVVSRSRRIRESKPPDEAVGPSRNLGFLRLPRIRRLIEISEDILIVETESLQKGFFKRFL